MTNARGMVAFSMPPTSAELPSMCKVLELDGNSASASRRSPPMRRVAGFCGLTSLVAPTAVAGPGGRESAPAEQPARIRLTAKAIAGPAGPNRLAPRRLRLRHRGEQPGGVVVLWPAEHVVGLTLFHDDAAEHHGDFVGEMLDHRKIVRDEQIRQTELLL